MDRQLPLEPTIRIDPSTQVEHMPGTDAVCLCRDYDEHLRNEDCAWPFCGWCRREDDDASTITHNDERIRYTQSGSDALPASSTDFARRADAARGGKGAVGSVPVMNDAAVRKLAQSDPVPQLAAKLGELVTETRTEVDRLTYLLRTIDKATEVLAEKGITVDADLGPIGNAAAAARRDLEKDRGPTFNLPA